MNYIFILHVICRTNFSCKRDSTLIEIQQAMLTEIKSARWKEKMDIMCDSKCQWRMSNDELK